MASPSGLEAAASESKANVLLGRASKQRTTRLAKWRSLRIAGTIPSHAGIGCDTASAIARAN
jgi:predicted sugar kinase